VEINTIQLKKIQMLSGHGMHVNPRCKGAIDRQTDNVMCCPLLTHAAGGRNTNSISVAFSRA